MLTWVEDLFRDLRYSARGLRRSPVFTLTAIGAVALGMGMNTAFFSLIHAVVFRTIPASDTATLRNVWVDATETGERSNRSSYGSRQYVSFAEFNSIRGQTRSAELAAAADVNVTMEQRSGAAGRSLHAQLVSDNLLPLLGARPVLGRFFARKETSHIGSSPVVVLTHRTWQEHFGGNTDVLSRPVTINRTVFTVIGVADAKTSGPMLEVPDLWIPMTMQPITRPGEPFINDPNSVWLRVIARKRPGVSDEQLRAELTVAAQQSYQDHTQRRAVVTVAPPALMNEPMVFSEGAPVAAILFAAFSMVLLIACTNVANMLLARGESRRREMAIRLSIGAGAARLVRQLLAESILLGVAGGLAGLALASVTSKLLLAALQKGQAATFQIDVSPDGVILAYTLGISLLTSVAFGLLPAIRAARVDPSPALKNETEAGSRRRFGLRGTLVGVQAAVCLMLLVSAALLLRGFERVSNMDLGRLRSKVLVASFDLRQQQFTAEQGEQFLRELRDQTAAVPGIRAASLSSLNPFHGGCNTMVRLKRDSERIRVGCEEVAEDYFPASGIPVVLGRSFTPAEVRGARDLIVVDQVFAARGFSGKDPLGQQLWTNGKPHEIIGVVGHTRNLEPFRAEQGYVYTPLRGLRHTEATLVAHYQGPSAQSAEAIRAAARRLNPNVNVSLAEIEDNISTALIPVRVAGLAAASLGALALVLACTGVYAVLAFAVSRRTREIGIRMALGAQPAQVLQMTLGQGLTPVFAGLAAGALMAAGASQLLRSFLYGLNPLDPLSFLAMSAILIAISTLAALGPARRAVRVDPSITLRHE